MVSGGMRIEVDWSFILRIFVKLRQN